MKNFAFTDSSGILSSDRFFGTGLLVVKNVGDLTDKLYKNSQPAKAVVKESKNRAIDDLLAKGQKDTAIQMLRGNYRFEMKFDYLGSQNTRPFYESMVDVFFSDPENRFSAMIVDRQSPSFDIGKMGDSWETYTKYIALLVAQEIRKCPDDEMCIVVDEITKPRTKALSLEDAVMSKIRDECARDDSLDFNKIYGSLTIESHSNLAMQLCDVLLGAVMFDYKEKGNLNSPRTQSKKEFLVGKIRNKLQVKTLASEFESDIAGAYFSVCHSD